jgi:hydrogenase maturation protease
MARTIILGLGNGLLSNDAVGLIAVDQLAKMVQRPELDFKTSEKSGLNLIDSVAGYDHAIIIDAILSGQNPPGAIIEFSLDDLPPNPKLRSPHDADFKSSIELGRQAGLKMPQDVSIFGIEIVDNLTFSPNLSTELIDKLPSILIKLIEKNTSCSWQSLSLDYGSLSH